MESNWTPFSFNFIFGNRKKSVGAKSEEYSEWGMCVVLLQKLLGEDWSQTLMRCCFSSAIRILGTYFAATQCMPNSFVRNYWHIP
jgi:hypothetical protein